MAKKKRPGVKSAESIAQMGSSSRTGLGGKSTHSAMSTRSGFSSAGKSSHHGMKWEDDDDRTTASGMSRPGLGGKGGAAGGVSMRSFMKTANSVASGLGGGSTHSGHKISHKQKKARPGLAVMPTNMQSTRTGISTRSGLSGGSGHSRKLRTGGTSDHAPKKQMSMRSLDSGKSSHSLSSAKSKRSLSSAKSKRSVASAHSKRSLNRSGHSVRSGGTSAMAPPSRAKSMRSVPEPPEDGSYSEYEEDLEEFDEDDEYSELMEEEEETVITMPQTEEEIRQGLHTEQVTKGFFRKKVRSIKWYSADIDKVDAGNYEPGETIEEEDEDEGSSEYETDTEDSEGEPVIPDPWYIALGRGLFLLEKKGEETTPIKRWLRCLTWLTFICDATAAIVSLVQFSEIQTCCGEPILNLGGIDIEWQTVIQYSTIFYLVLILLEVYPVMRRGFPFNIVNPLIGFMITFALFFDDSYVEALIMWCIETCAVLSEFAVYRVKIRQVNMRAIEIKKLMPKTTKKKESFEDEDDYLKELHKARRRYYVLKQEQRMDQRLLQYLHLAVYMNIVMSSVVLMLILVIARNGGLCIEDYDYPNPFRSDQLARCSYCSDPTEKCEYCDPLTETYQCYFPYS